ncbi:phosphatase PAP2 family protein [Yeosuana marina]|uniref:phosphatase PAP2 family protein n=1 Tax=Yeosuana marina TaxID=1565536 RepID=UPI0030EC563D|tara:strand:+ start:305 stop:979 length:675 start_codon:yes stop_codon:yes gene_type:complete
MDDFIIIALNNLANNESVLTKIMFAIVDNSLVKGGVMMAVLWYLWFNKNSLRSYNREKISLTLYTTILAIFIGRGLANLLPFRARPILNPEFNFPYELYGLDTWSSFPSDHAILFFALATGIFRVSKKWGLFSYAYVIVLICLPRIYLGFHYPTDVLAGAAIGVFLIWAISVLKISRRLEKKTITLSIKYPGIFYSCLFILSYQIATLFDDSRHLVNSMYHFFK